ncbi:hypothetical protein M0R19_00485 [Candidatus Pacearchaeota archaeon]|jgi:hypothetical protein|nr:hypothetical protein [Candidatus Pacearchaeota archaeon]
MKTLEEETNEKMEEPFPKKEEDFPKKDYERGKYTPEQAKKEHPLFYECWTGIN